MSACCQCLYWWCGPGWQSFGNRMCSKCTYLTISLRFVTVQWNGQGDCVHTLSNAIPCASRILPSWIHTTFAPKQNRIPLIVDLALTEPIRHTIVAPCATSYVLSVLYSCGVDYKVYNDQCRVAHHPRHIIALSWYNCRLRDLPIHCRAEIRVRIVSYAMDHRYLELKEDNVRPGIWNIGHGAETDRADRGLGGRYVMMLC